MLREADAELAAGASVPQIARKRGISEATFHRWRNHYGGMKADATKRLKKRERENARLKKIVAEQAVDIDILNLPFATGDFAAVIKPVAKFLLWPSCSVQAAFLSAG